MLGNYEELINMMDTIAHPKGKNSDGMFIDQQVEIQLNSLTRQLNQFKADIQGMAIDIGVNGHGLENIKELIKLIDRVVIGVQKIGDEWGGTLITVGEVAVGLTTVYKIVTAIDVLRKSMSMIRNGENMGTTLNPFQRWKENNSLVASNRAANALSYGTGATDEERANLAKKLREETQDQTVAVVQGNEAIRESNKETQKSTKETKNNAAANTANTKTQKIKNAVTNLGNKAMKGLGTATKAATIATAALGGPIGILITVLSIAGPAIIAYASSLGDTEQKTREAKEAHDEMIDSVSQQINDIDKSAREVELLGNTYNQLKDRMDSGALSADEYAKSQEKLEILRKALMKSGIEEAELFDENNKVKVDASKKFILAQQDEMEQAELNKINQIDADMAIAKADLEKTDTMIANAKARIEAMEDEATSIGIFSRIQAGYFRSMTDNPFMPEENKEQWEKLAQAVERSSSPQLELESLEAEKQGLEAKLAKLEKDKAAVEEKYATIAAARDTNVTPYNSGEAEEPADKKSSSGGKDSHSRQDRTKDPTIVSISSKVDQLVNNSSSQVQRLDTIISQRGASMELSKQEFAVFNKTIAGLETQRNKLGEYLQKSGNDTYGGKVGVNQGVAYDSVVEATAPYLGRTLENGTQACVEAVTKIGQTMNSFLAKELSKGVVSVPTLVSDAMADGVEVTSFDPAKVEAGDIIVYDSQDHVVMADGKGGYVGNSSGLNQVVHGSNYNQMNGQVPTQIIKTSMARLDALWNDSLSNYSIDDKGTKISKSDWESAAPTGKQSIIESALQVKGQEENKFLQAVLKTIVGGIEEYNKIVDAIETQKNQQADKWFSNINQEATQVETKQTYANNRELLLLGVNATEYDKARMELQKDRAKLQVMQDAMNRTETKSLEGMLQHQAYQDQINQQLLKITQDKLSVITTLYNQSKTALDHTKKMRDYGYQNTEDRVGTKRATDDLSDAMTQVKLLERQLELAKKTNSASTEELWKMEEDLKDAQDALRNAQKKYHQSIVDGFHQVTEDLIFGGKSFQDTLKDLWTELGKDSLKALFGKDISESHGLFASLLGIGKPNEEEAKEKAKKALDDPKNAPIVKNTTAIEALDSSINALNNTISGSDWGGRYYQAPKNTIESTGNKEVPMGGTTVNGKVWPEISLEEQWKLIEQTQDIVRMSKRSNGFALPYDFEIEEPIKQLTGTLGKAQRSIFQNTQSNKENTNAAQVNTNANLNVAQGIMGLAGAANSFRNGDWLGGILGIAQVGLGFGLFGGKKAIGGKFAKGGNMAGKIEGAGTGRSDSILAYLANKDKFVYLSDGEYVINEKSAKALGYDTLDTLNGYADGGVLNPTPYIPTINPKVEARATRINTGSLATEKLLRKQNAYMLEQNTLLRGMGESGSGQVIVLNTQASSADVMKALQENPRAVQSILGRQNRMGFR